MADTNLATKVVLKNVRFSYANVFVPKAAKGSTKLKYSVNVLIDKKDKTQVKKIKDAIEAARTAGAKILAGTNAKKHENPLKDGDDEKPGDEVYEGFYYINAKSDTKPGIIDKHGERLTADNFKSGDYGVVTINFYAFNNVAAGIGAGLGNILKSEDGDSLSGKPTAHEDFKDLLEGSDTGDDTTDDGDDDDAMDFLK